MMELTAPTVVIVISALLSGYVIQKLIDRVLYQRAMRQNGCKDIPRYPQKDPIMGYDIFLQWKQSVRDGEAFPLRMRNFLLYGRTHCYYSMGWNQVQTMDPENIQAICTFKFEKFGLATTRKMIANWWFGQGVMSRDGLEWKHSRAMLKPIFLRAQIANFSKLSNHVDNLMACIKTDGATVDLRPLFTRFYLDVSTDLLFGRSIASLTANNGEKPAVDAAEFVEAFETALRLVARRNRLGPLRIFLGRDMQLQNAAKVSRDLVGKYVEEALQRRASRNGKEVPEFTSLVDDLVQQTQDPEILTNELMHVFFAARDSSANGLNDLFFRLARHPHVWERLRNELMANGGEGPSFEKFKPTSLRLRSSAGSATRECYEDCVLPRGGGKDGKAPILVKKGTLVTMVMQCLHWDAEIWGSDADKFTPERWANVRQDWNYVPFLGGGRICPAQQMILTQYAYILYRFMTRFQRLENQDPCFEYVEDHHMTVTTRNGVKVALWE